MKRRLLFLLLCAAQSLFTIAQDEQMNIEVDVNGDQPVRKELNSCTLSLTASRFGNSPVELSIDLENNLQYSILLFAHAYTEKDLKKHKIRFDKKSYGSMSRNLLLCDGLDGDNILRVEPSSNRTLKFIASDNDMMLCELPLYFAKSKKNKHRIVNRVKIRLNVKLIQEDAEFDSINSSCKELIEEIGKFRVCSRPSHHESVEAQKAPYVNRIKELKEKITDIKVLHNWRDRDADYKKYRDLLMQLDNVEFKEEWCGCKPKVGISTHSCRFCQKTPSEVLTNVQRIYQKLDVDRIKKQAAKTEVEPWHRAWIGGCPNLKKKIDRDSNNRKKIESYYNSIINY